MRFFFLFQLQLLVGIVVSAGVGSQTGRWCSNENSESQLDKKPECSVGPDSLSKGLEVNGTVALVKLLPTWANLGKAEAGRLWALKNLNSIYWSHLIGLMAVLTFRESSRVMILTNRTTTVPNAVSRYGRTMITISSWYETSLFTYDSHDVNPVQQSIIRVRQLHMAARDEGNSRIKDNGRLLPKDYATGANLTLDHGLWADFNADLLNSNISEVDRLIKAPFNQEHAQFYAVNQMQLAIVHFVFMGFPVLYPERLGFGNLHDIKEDLEDFIHLWAIFGYALGIKDKFNVCLQPNFAEARAYFEKIYRMFLLPQLFNLSVEAKVLLEAQVRAFAIIHIGTYTPRQFLGRLLQFVGAASTRTAPDMPKIQILKLGRTAAPTFEQPNLSKPTKPTINKFFN